MNDILYLIQDLYDKRINNNQECNYLIIGGNYLKKFELELFNETLTGKSNKYLDMLIIKSKKNILEIAE